MKKITTIFTVSLISLFFSLFFHSTVLAYDCNDMCGDTGVGTELYTQCMEDCLMGNEETGGSNSGGGPVSLQDPLGIKDPRVIIKNVINVMLALVGSLALAVFIFGGFTWVISAGSDEKIKKGKDMVLWAALGLMLIFTSYAIINLVLTAVGGGTGGTPTTTGAPQQVGGGDTQSVGGD